MTIDSLPSTRTINVFLEKHFGHKWNGVFVDNAEYGMLGESLNILSPTETRPASHVQSTLLSYEVGVIVADKLAKQGFINPKHFTKMDTGVDGICILLTHAGVAKAMTDEAFKNVTAHEALIGDTGIRQKS